ncbi:hypothetical protein C8F04DRAFT_948573, partial [Mycena alexandri]
ATPDELKAFYRDMERGDLERKLSKRRSNSIWSRKSLKRTTSNQSQQTVSAPAPGPSLTSPSTTSLARRASRSIVEHDRGETADTVPPMPVPVSRSIIPDRLRELPTWYRDNNPSVRYNMHNPVGPTWYRNHHLIPPANARPLGRPPSVFSPSFPPMASSGSGLDRSEEPSRMPNLSRSSSNSPAPTPSSSQTQMENVPRSRKNSQTAHDNVDLLDGSDPWGNPWHHESPYDNGHAAPQNPNNVPRSRTSSVTTAQNRRKAVTPSPLSQSTSAIHLQIPGGGNGNGNAMPRRLSKRRTVGIFGGRQATSSPNSPVNEPNSRGTSPALLGPPPSFISATDKKEKRSSVFGRIAKRFSISRKPAVIAPMEVTRQPSPVKREPSPVKRQPSPEKRQPSPEKQPSAEPIKRVPPPMVHQESSSSVVTPPPPETSPQVEPDRASSISLEAETPYTMGRLTVANPDPGSVESTPVQREVPLPVEKRERAAEHERGATDDTLSAGPSEPQIVIQRTQSPVVRNSPSLEANSSRTSVPNQHQRPPSENIEVQSTRRAPSPAPPPAPEKPSGSASNGQRPNSSSAAPRTSAERSSSPPTASTSRGRTQSPPVGRLLDKPQPPPPQPSPKLPAVPFPPDYGAVTPTELAYRLPEMTADISPLSTSSMLVNPPTPYTKDMLMPDEPEAPPPVPSKRSSRDPSPSQVSVTGRETETFRLVRSASGTVYASSETIRAAGEQWEVVESSNSKGKNRSQDRDRDSESRKEQRRQAKAEKEADPEQQRMRSERKGRHRSPIPEMLVSRQEEPKASRSKRDDDRERKAERKSVPVDPKLDKPQPAPPPPLPPRNRSREQASKSARPTSEVPTAADMNMMKAREAWDMDRLWKARSMSGMEPTGVASAPAPTGPPVPNGKHAQAPPAAYGSSHTAFMVSTPFQQQPPTTNRASTSDLTATSNPISPRGPLANPLPEPPRESPYEPAPLKLPDYWGKHAAGVTTAH